MQVYTNKTNPNNLDKLGVVAVMCRDTFRWGGECFDQLTNDCSYKEKGHIKCCDQLS